MRDAPNYPADSGPYECLNCGSLLQDADAMVCPNCGGEVRNRKTPLE